MFQTSYINTKEDETVNPISDFVMIFALVMAVFGPLIAIITAMVIAEIKHKKETKRTNEILQKCMKNKGYEFVKNILEIAEKSELDHKHTMQLLMDSCGVTM